MFFSTIFFSLIFKVLAYWFHLKKTCSKFYKCLPSLPFPCSPFLPTISYELRTFHSLHLSSPFPCFLSIFSSFPPFPHFCPFFIPSLYIYSVNIFKIHINLGSIWMLGQLKLWSLRKKTTSVCVSWKPWRGNAVRFQEILEIGTIIVIWSLPLYEKNSLLYLTSLCVYSIFFFHFLGKSVSTSFSVHMTQKWQHFIFWEIGPSGFRTTTNWLLYLCFRVEILEEEKLMCSAPGLGLHSWSK